MFFNCLVLTRSSWGVKRENTAAIQDYSQAGFQRYQPDHPGEHRTTPGTLKFILYKPG
jgi:hypothetical protein